MLLDLPLYDFDLHVVGYINFIPILRYWGEVTMVYYTKLKNIFHQVLYLITIIRNIYLNLKKYSYAIFPILKNMI